MQFNIVEESDKSAFPGKYFKDHLFDIKVFKMADHMIKDYSGGNWDYVETETGAAFMNLAGDQILINPFSGVEVAIPADSYLSGMIVTSNAMLLAMERGADLGDAYHKLFDAMVDRCSELKRMDIYSDLLD